MSDVVTLTRLSLKRWRLTLIASLAYSLFVCAALIFLTQIGVPFIDQQWWDDNVALLVVFLTMPSIVVAFAVFDLDGGKIAEEQGCAYPGWLLRSPIATWKLALVPELLRTLWIIGLCSLAAISTQWLPNPAQRWLIPSLAISCIPLFTRAIAYRPFYYRYSRIVLCIVLIVPCFLWLIYNAATVFMVDLSRELQISIGSGSQVESGIAIAVATVYTGLLIFAVHCLRQGRFNVLGRIPEKPYDTRSLAQTSSHLSDSKKTEYAQRFSGPIKHGAIKPIVGYHYAMLQRLMHSKIVVGMFLTVVAFAMIAGKATIAFVVILVTFLWVFSTMLTSFTYHQIETDGMSKLMSNSPISSATLAWTRQAFAAGVTLVLLASVPLIMVVWFLTGASESMNDGFVLAVDSAFSGQSQSYQVAFLIALVTVLVITKQISRASIAVSRNSSRGELVRLILIIGTVFAILCAFLYHFLQFPSWESWQRWAWDQIQFGKHLLLVGSAVSLGLAVYYTVCLNQSRLVNKRAISVIWFAFVIVVLAGSFLANQSVPVENVSQLHWLALFALITPLNSILAAPLWVDSLRHR